ncbi:MAG: SPASM domain-containing protein, partial [Clostridium sp.]|nr:SPASM domain-containing protein [Clostridium sp.]
IINKFSLAKDLGVKRLMISFTPTKFNITDLANIPEFAVENRIDSIHITRLLPVGRGTLNKKDITPEEDQYSESIKGFINNIQNVNRKIHYKRETAEFFLEEEEKTQYMGLTMGADQSEKVLFRNKRMNCSLGCNTLSISYDGYFYPCPSLHHDPHKLGSLEDPNLNNIIQYSHKLVDGFSVDHIENCKVCDLKYFCGGGCRAVALANDGTILGNDPLCDYYKESMFEIMWNFRL